MDTTLVLTMLTVGLLVRLFSGMAAGLTPALLTVRTTRTLPNRPATGGLR
jgi:hypothetical protein